MNWQTWFVISSLGLVILCLSVECFLVRWDSNIIYLRLIVRMVTDNALHAVIGGWCWFNVWLLQLKDEWSKLRLIQVAVCAVMSSLLDVDHIIEARSLSFETVMKLPHRPFLHNTTLILLIVTVLYAMVYFIPQLKNNSFMSDFPAMFLVSCLSHHLRDADRRGVWLAPFGCTPQLPYKSYVLLVVLLPIVIVGCKTIFRVVKEKMELRNSMRFQQTVPTSLA